MPSPVATKSVLSRIGLLLSVLLIAACASARLEGKLSDTLQLFMQELRWQGFANVPAFIDPEREDLKPDAFVRARAENYRVVGLREVSRQSLGEHEIAQRLEIAVINQHTQAQKTYVAALRWHWDEQREAWLLQSKLPLPPR